MRYYMDWKQWSNQPHIKQLIETKGVETARIQYIKESNKAMWDDPVMLTETNSPGMATSANNNAAAGHSTQFITGYTSETRTINWTAGNFTASNAPAFEAVNYFDLEGIKSGVTDFTSGHDATFRRFRVFLTTGSAATLSLPAGFHGVLTASVQSNVFPAAGVSSSVLNGIKDSINNTPIIASVGGVINTFDVAAKDLFTATLNSASSSLTITFNNPGNVNNYGVAYPDTVSGSFSSTGTSGNDTYHYQPGTQVFDGKTAPYTNMPRKS